MKPSTMYLRALVIISSVQTVGDRLQGARSLKPESESGQTIVEYAMILVAVAIAVIAALLVISGHISTFFSEAGSKI